MVQAEFYKTKGIFSGFKISGHTGYAPRGRDIVCAAVSSAVQLTVNMLYEFKIDVKATSDGGAVRCVVKNAGDDISPRIIRQLMHHFELILEDFPKTIKITISEV
ncbi:MAG: ribosomal-processing cysteine protease Prp [Ruminococcus flavefaciens]|nr:ribosomal-processing cysteine protease Prp [Ruminococcus flavefaciens]MCM1230462.1 ribosomal-processing cysteine protease Prp [Ruminococcus flavefaciens]